MPRVYMTEEMVKDFAKLRDFMNHSDEAFRVMLNQLEANRKIIECQRAVMRSLYENIMSPFVCGIEGVSKMRKNDTSPGAGAGDEDGAVILSFVASEAELPDAVTEMHMENGTRRVAIPDTVAKLIGEKQQEIESIINRFDENARDVETREDFDLHMNSATIEIQHLLDITYNEARILFRLFMAQFLGMA